MNTMATLIAYHFFPKKSTLNIIFEKEQTKQILRLLLKPNSRYKKRTIDFIYFASFVLH